MYFYINPLTDEQHFDVPQNIASLPFGFTFYILFRTQNDQPASSLLADILHPEQNIESVNNKMANLSSMRHIIAGHQLKG